MATDSFIFVWMHENIEWCAKQLDMNLSDYVRFGTFGMVDRMKLVW